MFHLNYRISPLIPIVIGMILGIYTLTYYQKNYAYHNLNELALGTENDSSFAKINGVPIHCVDHSDARACLDGYQKSALKKLVIWFGNSQIHAINQKKPTDKTAVPAIHYSLKENEQYFMAFTQSNSNLQEHYLLLEYLLTQSPIETIVLPLIFDDMRELGIRDSLLSMLIEPGVKESLTSTPLGQSLLVNHQQPESSENDLADLKGSVQENVETQLNALLESQSELWENRASLRGHILKQLYRFRNRLLGIKTTSVRKKIPARYKKNMSALEAILATAATHNIRVLTYIAPLRDDVKSPYKHSEYQLFKQDVVSVTEHKQGVTLVNLEGLIPAPLWGERGTGQIDFMHFQAGGHKLIAKALSNALIEMENGLKPQ